MTLEEALVSVWQQVLVDKSATVEVDGKSYPGRTTSKRKLKQIDFVYDGREIVVLAGILHNYKKLTVRPAVFFQASVTFSKEPSTGLGFASRASSKPA